MMRRNPLDWLCDVLLTVTAFPVLAMMVHVTLDVLLKYTIRMPLQGTLEITSYYYMVSVVLLPLGFVEATRQSIAVDLFYQLMGPRLQVAVTLLVLTVCAVGYGGLAIASIPDALRGFERQEIVMGTINIYIWPARFLLPVTFALAMGICLMHLLRMFTNPTARAELIAIHAIDPDQKVD